ncbi:TerD family protein [Brevundimonas sp.]|uniref:TerD family protein n=1 Tax=Brevundimonas sp. TaxID=1871086 RepID=UPI002FC82909
MSKGQSVSLEKRGGGDLTQVIMGLGWDVAKKKGLFGLKPGASVDLDASCVMFNSAGELVDTVWFRQLRSRDGSVVHTGDNRTGDGDGDDEQIKVDLTRVPAEVSTLVFTVNSFTGITFETIENAACRIVDQTSGDELARYNLSGSGRHTAQIMAKLTRGSGHWTMTAIGETASGRTMLDLLPTIRSKL